MKRPTQHIIETISNLIFEDLIPVEWVIRDKYILSLLFANQLQFRQTNIAEQQNKQ